MFDQPAPWNTPERAKNGQNSISLSWHLQTPPLSKPFQRFCPKKINYVSADFVATQLLSIMNTSKWKLKQLLRLDNQADWVVTHPLPFAPLDHYPKLRNKRAPSATDHRGERWTTPKPKEVGAIQFLHQCHIACLYWLTRPFSCQPTVVVSGTWHHDPNALWQTCAFIQPLTANTLA